MSQLLQSTGRLAIVLAVAAVVTNFGGCAPPEIDVTYGKRRGSSGGDSVSGTAVLAGMFESAGHRVTGWRRLSPKLEACDIIVWFPDTYSLPQPEHREFLEEWLASKAGRTLVYVGRDYDAGTAYWKRIRPLTPPPQALEVARRAALSQALSDARRAKSLKSEDCDWFAARVDLPPRRLARLAGPWAEGIDLTQLELEAGARFAAPSAESLAVWNGRGAASTAVGEPTLERLLDAGEDPLVTRLCRSRWDRSQILVVTNGSFLVNLSLVNHEHRKLAGKLINACGPAGRVVFLESGEGGPPILDEEPGVNAPTGFEVFTVWPIGVILLHITALGILACIALFPVFGRPRELPLATTADFGQHISALGELLEMTRDRDYAINRLRQYQEQLKHASTTKSNRKR